MKSASSPPRKQIWPLREPSAEARPICLCWPRPSSHRAFQELGQADQIVGRERQREGSVHPVAASQLHLGQTGGTLDPAEHLFDAFAAALTDVVAGMGVVRPSTAVLRRLPVLLRCPSIAMCGVTDRSLRSCTNCVTS